MANRLTTRVLFVLVVASLLCAAGWARDPGLGNLAVTDGLAAGPEVDKGVTEGTAEVANVTAVTDEPLQVGAECAESDQLDFTPALSPAASSTDELVASNAAARCKTCKDRTWCKCTYNGLPRVSCNPCCYGNLGIPQVCLD